MARSTQDAILATRNNTPDGIGYLQTIRAAVDEHIWFWERLHTDMRLYNTSKSPYPVFTELWGKQVNRFEWADMVSHQVKLFPITKVSLAANWAWYDPDGTSEGKRRFDEEQSCLPLNEQRKYPEIVDLSRGEHIPPGWVIAFKPVRGKHTSPRLWEKKIGGRRADNPLYGGHIDTDYSKFTYASEHPFIGDGFAYLMHAFPEYSQAYIWLTGGY